MRLRSVHAGYTGRLLTTYLAILLILLSGLPAGYCQGLSGSTGTSRDPAPSKPLCEITVLPAQGQPEKVEAVPLAITKQLPEQRVDELLSRLNPIKVGESNQFRLPEQSLVRPQIPGIKTKETFPLKPSALQSPKPSLLKTPLRVLRVSPRGAVDTIKQLAVTFSQPMVPIGAATTADATEYLKLTPQPEGVWRWMGTQTIVFDPKSKRFPKATNYTVTVPKTTLSTGGSHLEEEQSVRISTPSVHVTNFYPGKGIPQTPSPVMLAFFDQDIDRQAVLAHTELTIGVRKYPLQAVSDQVIEKDEEYQKLIHGRKKNQWLAFQPATPLPLGRSAIVTFAVGCPSMEGPLKTLKGQQYSVNIHGALTLKTFPRSGQTVWPKMAEAWGFTNILDAKHFKQSNIKISPLIQDQKVECHGTDLMITATYRTHTKYTVTIDGDLTDIYGQKLGRTIVKSFVTGARSPYVKNDSYFATIPFGQKPVYAMWAQGVPSVKVSIYKTRGEDWPKYREHKWEKSKQPPVGILVATKVFHVGPESAAIDVDLGPYLSHGYGQFVLVTDTPGAPNTLFRKTATWVQVTAMGVDAFPGRQLNVLTTVLADAKPIRDVQVTLLPINSRALTDSSGLAKLPIPKASTLSHFLIAKNGPDTAILPDMDSTWSFAPQKPGVAWYAVSDRGLYKPGEHVQIKGWARGVRLSPKDAIDLYDCKLDAVNYTLTEANGIELKRGTASVDSSGGFSFEVAIPEKINLGPADINVKIPVKQSAKLRKSIGEPEVTNAAVEAGADGTSIPITIQEFRRPDFEMKVTSSRGNTIFSGDDTTITSKAGYFGGGTLATTTVNWVVTAEPATYSPVGWPDFVFGKQSRLWEQNQTYSDGINPTKTVKGVTDAKGVHVINLRVDRFREGLPVSCKCEATVSDVNRQTWSDNVTMLVHSAKNYVGIKPGKCFFHTGEPIDLKVIATDIDGKVTPGKTIDLKLVKSGDDNKQTEIANQTLLSEAQPKSVAFATTEGGQYKVIATVHDAEGNQNVTTISTWIEGRESTAAQALKLQTILLVPDHDQYQAGETAEIMINTPVYPAHGVVTIRRSTTVSTLPITVMSSSQVLKIPITQDYYSNVGIGVYLTGKDFTFASGSVDLKVPPVARRLTMSALAASQEIAPGGDTSIDIDVKDSDGKAVPSAEVAIVVADESILALANYQRPDPLEVFYPSVTSYENNTYLRSSILFSKENKPAQRVGYLKARGAGFGYMGGLAGLVGAPVDPRYGQSNEVGPASAYSSRANYMLRFPVCKEEFVSSGLGRPLPIVLRTNFSPLALFEPAVITDQNGKAKVKLHLPDSLTRYRIMAVATSGTDKFGSTESNITARLPLTVKPSAPRFLNFGDHCQLPLVIQNQTDKSLKVEVVTRGQNAFVDQASSEEQQSAGRLVEVPAHDRVEVRFPMTTINAGTAQFQCAAVSGDLSDAADFSVPVYMPASTETFATYGQIDHDAIMQKLDRPADVFEQVGGLTITTSSTAVQALTDAYVYLKDYGFECSEQISSRTLAMLSLHEVRTAFDKFKGVSENQFKAAVQKDIDTLLSRQNSDGGFGLWTAGEAERWPYVSLQVAQTLHLAKDKGYKVDASKLALCHGYMTNIARYIPKDYDKRTGISLEARALNIRYKQNDIDATAARGLIYRALKDKIPMPLECAAWLLPLLSKDKASKPELLSLRQLIDNQIKETASTASANEVGYGECSYCMFYSPRRTDAVILDALMADQPKSELIAKFARGLLAHRKNGAWNGTQENGYVLQALGNYFAKYEKQTPDFESQEWLGDTLVGLQKYSGRSTESKDISIPMEYLLHHSGGEIVVNKTGTGRLYYRLGLDYAPRNLNLKSADFGFSVRRRYEGVDNKSDVRQDADGIWHIKAGATVRSKLHFSTPGARYHVALTDPLPAGAEAINVELAGNRTVIPETAADRNAKVQEGDSIDDSGPSQFRCWQPGWFEHQNLRDHQAEAFTSLLCAGEYDYSYLMRATTPGDYHVPPTKVEEMYASETFGRAGTEHVVVE